MPVPTSVDAFGAGGDEPYAQALLDPARRLTLLPAEPGAPGVAIDVQRFCAADDDADRSTLSGARGPVLDIGCGPGRMVRAAALAGHVAMGVDVSAAAVAIARARGLAVLRRSVFDELPGTGRWGTALLLDGNIGIGGDPVLLLRRCRRLIRASGRVVVEAHPDPDRDRRFRGRITDDLGRSSRPFRWAEAGAAPLRRHARAAGLSVVREWGAQGRSFVELGART